MSLNHQWLKKPNVSTDKIKELYSSGLSGTQIGAKLGLSKSSVTRRLKKAGVQIRMTNEYEGEGRYWLWKGENYIDPITRKRNQRKHRVWARAVLKRDNHVCQDCGKEGGNSYQNRSLHAHHIIAMRDCINSKLEFDVSNGITLCPKCHKKIHSLQIA